MKSAALIFFLALVHALAASPQPDVSVRARYIEQHKDLACRQMLLHGVPASITLAQGILESASGTSILVDSANNHFGIKHGGRWKGPVFEAYDDDYENGVLKKSPFRKYVSTEASFNDHSLFLKTNKRYDSLFVLHILDYWSWCQELQRMEYATDKGYAKKLLGIIELNHLYRFDLEVREDMLLREAFPNINNSELPALSNIEQPAQTDIVYEGPKGKTNTPIKQEQQKAKILLPQPPPARKKKLPTESNNGGRD